MRNSHWEWSNQPTEVWFENQSWSSFDAAAAFFIVKSFYTALPCRYLLLKRKIKTIHLILLSSYIVIESDKIILFQRGLLLQCQHCSHIIEHFALGFSLGTFFLTPHSMYYNVLYVQCTMYYDAAYIQSMYYIKNSFLGKSQICKLFITTASIVSIDIDFYIYLYLYISISVLILIFSAGT